MLINKFNNSCARNVECNWEMMHKMQLLGKL